MCNRRHNFLRCYVESRNYRRLNALVPETLSLYLWFGASLALCGYWCRFAFTACQWFAALLGIILGSPATGFTATSIASLVYLSSHSPDTSVSARSCISCASSLITASSLIGPVIFTPISANPMGIRRPITGSVSIPVLSKQWNISTEKAIPSASWLYDDIVTFRPTKRKENELE